MAGRILRRCTLCSKFHAAYLIQDPELGKCYICYACWKARAAAPMQDEKNTEKSETQAEPQPKIVIKNRSR